jgi:hypothetical protein
MADILQEKTYMARCLLVQFYYHFRFLVITIYYFLLRGSAVGRPPYLKPLPPGAVGQPPYLQHRYTCAVGQPPYLKHPGAVNIQMPRRVWTCLPSQPRTDMSF